MLRYDRRGVGDSEGENGGYASELADIDAAMAALRREVSSATRIVAMGNCDAASALMLAGGAGADALVLSNPWTIIDETEGAADMPVQALRAHYRARLTNFAAIKRLLTGQTKFYTNNVFGAVAGGPPLGGAVNSGNSLDHDKSMMVDYQRTFLPTLLQDFRFAFSRIYVQELQLDSNLNSATTVGIPDINLGTIYTTGLPQLNIAGPVGTFAMGDFGLPFYETETNFQFFDNWTKTSGRHSFKFGGEVSKFFGIPTDVSGRGSFSFAQSTTGLNDPECVPNCPSTGSGMASFLLGLPNSFGRDITLVHLRKTVEIRFLRAGYLAGDTQADRYVGSAVGLSQPDLHTQRAECRQH